MFIYDQQGAIALGREEGIQQGIQQGKRNIARNLLGQLNDEAIAQITGLSLEAFAERGVSRIATLRQAANND